MKNDSTYIYIGSNKYQLYGKTITLVIFIFIIGMICTHPMKWNSNGNYPPIFILYFFFPLMGLLLLTMLIVMTLELFFMSKSIEIDFKNKTLLLKYLFIQSDMLVLDDIIQYSETTISTKSSSYECYLIYTQNNRKHLLGDFNLAEHLPIKTFLDENEIKFIGHEKISIFSYFINYFKNKNN